MIIRCERCSTLYDLDESLLASGGSQVQCARCQAVFTAVPPPAGGKPPGPVAPPPGGPPPQATPAPGPASRPSDPPRPTRTGPNIYRPPAPAVATTAPLPGRGRAGAPARNAVSAMDARLRSLARWKLAVVPLGIVLLLVLGYGGWSMWQRRPDPETQRQRAEAMALIAQDDAASLTRALELLEPIQQGHHASSGAAGERGLARALLAAAQAEESEPLADRLAAASAEKARLEREQPPGFEDAQRALAMEVARLEVELAPKRQKLEAIQARAAEELRAVAAESKRARDAGRGQAVLAVLQSDSEEVARAAGLLRATGPDAWADLVDLWLAVRRDGAARDQAIPRLGTLVAAHPELIRARFILARALVSAGRREEAISTVGRLLAANPRHERAQRLRAQLAAPAVVVVTPAPAPPPPAPGRPVLLPRPAPAPQASVNAAPPAAPPQASVNQAVPVPSPVPQEVPLPPPPQPPKPKPPEPVRALEPSEG